MKRLAVALWTVAIAVCGMNIGIAQTISDAEVDAALKAGASRKFDKLVSECSATAGFGESLGAGLSGGIQRTGSFNILVSSNAGRIAFLAAQAKRLYKSFGPSDVPDSLRVPGAFVTIEPDTPSQLGNVYSVPAEIESVVLKSKVRPDVVIQPESFVTEPVEWKNLLGGSVAGNRAVATFSFDAIRELPSGDFDVVVITAAGERRCKVGSKDRDKVFGSR